MAGWVGLGYAYLKASPMPLAHFGLLFFDVSFRISLLNFVLVRWCQDAVSMSLVFQLTLIWGVDVGSFGAQHVLFGMPVASTFSPWGTIERSRGTWEHKTGGHGVQASISIDFVFFTCLFPGLVFE